MGEAPTVVKSETLSYLSGPVWRIELTSAVWPEASAGRIKKTSAAKP